MFVASEVSASKILFEMLLFFRFAYGSSRVRVVCEHRLNDTRIDTTQIQRLERFFIAFSQFFIFYSASGHETLRERKKR